MRVLKVGTWLLIRIYNSRETRSRYDVLTNSVAIAAASKSPPATRITLVGLLRTMCGKTAVAGIFGSSGLRKSVDFDFTQPGDIVRWARLSDVESHPIYRDARKRDPIILSVKHIIQIGGFTSN